MPATFLACRQPCADVASALHVPPSELTYYEADGKPPSRRHQSCGPAQDAKRKAAYPIRALASESPAPRFPTMSENGSIANVDQLKARVADLAAEQIEAEQTAGLLRKELETARDRAEYLELSELALQRLANMYQSVLRSMRAGVIVAD